MKWIRKEEIGIEEKEYKKTIKKYPVIKRLEKLIEDYNDFLEGEYNNCECVGKDIFKEMFDLIRLKEVKNDD